MRSPPRSVARPPRTPPDATHRAPAHAALARGWYSACSYSDYIRRAACELTTAPDPSDMTIAVAIVEDQRMMRELLRAVLSREADIDVVAEAESGAQALSLVKARAPDIMLLDIGLPDIEGVAVARAIARSTQRTRLIALSMYTEPRIVEDILKAGARGYVVKSGSPDEVVRAIRAVAEGELYLSPEVEAARRQAVQVEEPPVDVLGRREQEVLARLADGK